MKNNLIFQNVSISTITFINNKNDIKFEFVDSYQRSGKYCGELICVNFSSLNMHADLNDDPFFPQFICDISVEQIHNIKNCFHIEFLGGAYDISITCENFEILRPE